MAHWCESCGQELPEGEAPTSATWLGAPGLGHEHTLAKPAGSARSGRDKKLLMGVIAVVAVWGAFVGVSQVVTPDDSIDEQAAIDIEEARVAREQREAESQRIAEEREVAEEPGAPAALTEGLDEVYGDADAAPAGRIGESDEADDHDRVKITVQVERLQRQLIRRDSSAVVAYRSDDGVVIINLTAGTSQVADLTTGATTIDAGAFLLRSGASTFAIDPASLAVAQVVDDSSLVVTRAEDGNSYFVGAATLGEHSAVVEVVADGELSAHLAPGGYTLRALDGLGLIAVPKSPTGSTLISAADEFVTLSENRVLTANSSAILEQACVNPTACTLEVASRLTDSAWTVPANFSRLGDQFVLSPAGTSLLRYTSEGFAEVYESESDDVSWVIGAGMQSPAWGPGSNFVTWLDLGGDPKLKVMFLDERDWLTIDLRDLDAPPPTSPELIVFTPTAEPAA